ncbi:unnamed protein product [Trichobilharzia szidati]|nr:unnamed protein product [Trichobilharzia szidati]
MGLLNSTIKSESLQCLFEESERRIKAEDNFHCSPFRSIFVFLQSVHESSFNQRRLVFRHFVRLLNHNFDEIREGFITVRTYDIRFDYVHNNRNVVLSWPLHGLRWYGSNKYLFVFESGRRCQLGPALFMFKCKRPQKLVDRVEKQINLLSCLHSSLQFLSEPSDHVQELHTYLETMNSLPRTSVTRNAYSLQSSSGDAGESRQLDFDLLSSIVLTSGSDGYLIPRNISERHSPDSASDIRACNSPMEPLLPTSVDLHLINDNYLQVVSAFDIPPNSVESPNGSQFGQYVVLASHPHNISTDSSTNLRFPTAMRLNNEYVQDLV